LWTRCIRPGARPVGCWARKQEKLAIEQTSGRDRINIHGAIDLATGQPARDRTTGPTSQKDIPIPARLRAHSRPRRSRQSNKILSVSRSTLVVALNEGANLLELRHGALPLLGSKMPLQTKMPSENERASSLKRVGQVGLAPPWPPSSGRRLKFRQALPTAPRSSLPAHAACQRGCTRLTRAWDRTSPAAVRQADRQPPERLRDKVREPFQRSPSS
jgi:hypothetical protein